MSGTTCLVKQLSGCDRCAWHLTDLSQCSSVHFVGNTLFDESAENQSADTVILTGFATKDDTELLHRLRNDANRIILYGTCPYTGGIFGLANQRSGNVIPVSDIIHVDHIITGCAPNPETLREILEGKEQTPLVNLCESCERSVQTGYLDTLERQPKQDDQSVCMNNQGVECHGVVSGFCYQRCIDYNMPCRGCVPMRDDASAGMLGYFTSIAGQIEVDTRATEWTTDMLGDKPDALSDGLQDVTGTFFRFTLAREFRKGGTLPSSGDIFTDVLLGRRIEELPQIAGTIYGSRGISVALNILEAYEKALGLSVPDETMKLRKELRQVQSAWLKMGDSPDSAGFEKIVKQVRDIAGNEVLSNLGVSGFRTSIDSSKDPFEKYQATEFVFQNLESASEDEYSKLSFSLDDNGLVREWSCEFR